MDALRLLSRSTTLKGQRTGTVPQTVPSEGTSATQGLLPPKDKKRKRDADDVETTAFLNESEIREVQKRHKIRIVNLRKLHRTSSSKTKKQQKESARLFPQPLTAFKQLRTGYGVSKSVLDNVIEQGYYEPTEVQLATVPVLLGESDSSPDLLTVAPTGSGKTLAFLLPVIEKIRRQHRARPASDGRHTSVIILAPTKELVNQIENEGRRLCARTGVSITAMRKGLKLTAASDDNNISEDSEDEQPETATVPIVKTDIVVATPLSLVNAIGSESLPHVTTLILDEADVLLDPLFREQTLDTWRACVSPELRISMWSATIGASIEDLAFKTIRQRRKDLSLPSKPKIPIYRIIIGLKDSSLPSITHKLIYAATEPGKLLGLRQLLRPSSSTDTTTTPLRPPFLVFTQTIERAVALHTELQYDIPATAGGSTRIAVLHSDLGTAARAQIMARFRRGEIWVLITTDLLSRGVDFRGVNGVVNYDIPTTSAAYVHRAGRTGRAGRSGGVCVTFYTREDVKYLKAIASVIKASQNQRSTQEGHEESDIAGGAVEGLPAWLMSSLPELTRKDRAELKKRGVVTRRAIKESDNDKERKSKRRSRIGTRSGYEKQVENKRKSMVDASKARKRRMSNEDQSEEDGDFQGFD
jgi:ATP-dependent RNA helicase DDX52/ROK1